ncbi:MAG: hypothetical protein Q7T53_08410 [Deltaproteobacteria bacterium]|nr:hypothetical protein [Deltaproteobacteria bacterium]
MEPIAHLEKKIQDALQVLTGEISLLCKDNLLSIYLYGSAAGKGYIPEKSNLNTLILLKKIEIETLKGIARVYKKNSRFRIVAPLVLTPDYIRSSTDVFPIEFLDIKENSILLSGYDALKDIDIDLSQLREECEREIKGQLVRFRGAFLEVEGDKKGMERLVITAVSNLVFPVKNILRLMRQEMPEGTDAVIKSCCKVMNVMDTPFLEALTIKKGGRQVSLEELYAVISGYMDSLEEISKKIDEMKAEGRL